MTQLREDLFANAKRLAAAKEEALGALVDATETIADLNDQLTAAQAHWGQKLQAAKKAGYTDQELTTIGFDLTGGTPKPGRGSGRRNTKKDNSTTPAASGSAAPASSPVTGSTT
ncbi:hypothetical protein [Kribbella sp. NPDC048928]|uniref:hypothetical protein n=1 Tax=Kribbella sp. NPDC048928 TaxID=3364111 RepID=UPI003712FBB1